MADATSLTEAGFVGEDVESILQRLIDAADGDIARAQTGIVYIDEIDKLACGYRVNINNHSLGEGVQQALLKIIEGTDACVQPRGGQRGSGQAPLHIDTTNILFILGGAFPGIEDIASLRMRDKGVGFCAPTSQSPKDELSSCGVEVLPEDLNAYGLIPEFVGRIPIIVHIAELDEGQLVKVLTDPKDSLVRQYEYLFALDDARLEFEVSALHAIAHEASARGTGARGLRSVCERVLQDAMFKVPSDKSIEKVIVTEECVTKGSEPQLVRRNRDVSRSKRATRRRHAS